MISNTIWEGPIIHSPKQRKIMPLTAYGKLVGFSEGIVTKMRKHPSILLLCCCLAASAGSFGQVTLSETNTPLQKVFQKIQKQSGYDFLFSYELLEAAGKVSVKVNNVTLQQAVEECLKGKGLTYEILGKTVIIKLKEAEIKKENIPSPLTEVNGTVVNEKGEPLESVSVIVKGTNRGTITNVKGEFTLTGIGDKASLTFSATNIEGFEVKLNGKTILNVTAKTKVSKLDDIQIVAYGTSTQRYNVGSVSKITSEEIQRQPVTNVLLALEGQVPGLFVAPTSGIPGAAVKVQLRGQNSLKSNLLNSAKPFDQPLFIVDGMPLATQNGNINIFFSLGTGAADRFDVGGGFSPLNSINPADIESISFLRDADATSIYGTQGANGVILITTKKGKPGKTSLDISVNTGITVSTRSVEMLNTQQYLDLRREAFKNDGFTGTFQGTNSSNPGYAPDLTIFDQNKGKDWYKYLVGSTTRTTNAHASLSGGSVATNFIVSAGYTHTGYNFPGDYADDRLTLHTGFQHSALNNRFNINFVSDFGYNHNNSSAVPTIIRNILAPPNLPDLVDAAGKLVWQYQGYDLSTYQTESYLKKTSSIESFNMNNSVRISYQIIPSLKISTNLGYSRLNSIELQKDPIASQSPLIPVATANFGNSTFQVINIEPQLDYKHQLGKGDLTMLVAGTYKKSISNQINLQGVGYANDALLGSITGATTKYASEFFNTYKYAAVFGRIGYVYDRKYIINLTGRRDGSSNFGPGRQFGNFGSAALGWIFSEEKIFKSALPFISYGKLSGNYGTSGSDAIAPYNFQAFWRPDANALPFQGVTPIRAVNHYNPIYSWDLKKSINIAFDLGFWENRLLVNATWYQNRSGNQLVDYRLPIQTGFSSVLQNLDAIVQNRGWEFSFTSNNINAKKFKWTTNFNISVNKNSLLAFPGLATSSYASIYTIGKSVNTINVIQYKGVNDTTGLFEFLDKNGTLKNNASGIAAVLGGDALPLVDNTPKFFGGMGNTLSYKNLSLSFYFQFSKQTAVNYLGTIYRQQPNPGGLQNQPVAILNRWRAPGDISEVQRLSATTGTAFTRANLFTNSTGAYSDASYIRLKTVALSYSLPALLLKKLKIKSCNFFVNAQNLLTITGYKVGDPQVGGGLFSFPLQRTIVSGLSFNF